MGLPRQNQTLDLTIEVKENLAASLPDRPKSPYLQIVVYPYGCRTAIDAISLVDSL
jgi:hypothetical protein